MAGAEDSSSPRSVSCVFCDKQLPSAEDLRTHLDEHKNTLPGKKSGLTAGVLAKNGYNRNSDATKPRLQPRVQCDECDEMFPSLTHAMTHKFRKHPNSMKRYSCPFCGKNFPLKAGLENHQKFSHADEVESELLACPACSDVFYNQPAVDYHMDFVHKRSGMVAQPIQTMPPSRKIRVNNAGEVAHAIYCHLCGCEYMMKFNLKKHLLTEHTDVERVEPPKALIKCDQCSAMFYSEKAYKSHLVHHSPDDLYVQAEGLSCATRIDADFNAARVVPRKGKKDCPKELLRSIFGEERLAFPRNVSQVGESSGSSSQVSSEGAVGDDEPETIGLERPDVDLLNPSRVSVKLVRLPAEVVDQAMAKRRKI